MKIRTLPCCVAAVSLLAGCTADRDPEMRFVRTDTVHVTGTLITAESGLLGGIVTALEVGPDGRIHVSDAQSNRIVSTDPDGDEAHMYGREGEGPGEFRVPGPIAVSASGIHVLDLGNRRIQRFEPDGTFAGSTTLTVPSTPIPQVGPQGEVAVPTGGRDGSLVLRVSRDGREATHVGEPLAAASVSPVLDARLMKEQASRGGVPDEIRNDVVPTWGEDGAIFLSFVAEPEVRRYDESGELRWATRLDEPQVEAVREDFFRRNREEPNPERFFPLRYLRGSTFAGGDLWVMLNGGDPAFRTVLVLDGGDGSLRRRLVLATDGLNLGLFGVDPTRGRLHAYAAGEARVVTFDTGRDPQ